MSDDKPKISWRHVKVDVGSGTVNSGIATHFLNGGADAVIATIQKIPVGRIFSKQETASVPDNDMPLGEKKDAAD